MTASAAAAGYSFFVEGTFDMDVTIVADRRRLRCCRGSNLASAAAGPRGSVLVCRPTSVSVRPSRPSGRLSCLPL